MRGFRAYLITSGLLVATYLVGGLSGWWKGVSFQGLTQGGGSGWGGGFRGGK